ncbi:hypothetical protein GGR54DRAFT_494802 [Hypoxylon sp. NC1633]|nr:hypothetical protein GGR54DRAFT_494802 [Hypoxylon sp. NC1633]
MMEAPPTPEKPTDGSAPFAGLVLCCTSVEADLRTQIAQRTIDLGGKHKYDLTPDVTHLIVGEYDTAKYRHVARERPDIQPMAAGWVEAVRDMWLNDKEFDFAALEDAWKLRTFETGGGVPKSPIEELRKRTKLVCCLTGFEDGEMRAMIESKVKTNGGDYMGDLSRRVTHLIVCKPEGKKYIAARRWGIRTVSVEWLHDSVERGMILNEECYDPTFPAEERGKGAWIRRDLKQGGFLGKRQRDGATVPPADEGRRKLRKTASMKLTSQKDDLWGDILVRQSAGDLSKTATIAVDRTPSSIPPTLAPTNSPPPTADQPQIAKPDDRVLQGNGGVFASCRFYVYGFPLSKQQIVELHISSHGGHISRSIEDAASSVDGGLSDQRYLVVPQTSQHDSHPALPESMHVVTEFYIERCVHNKMLFKPDEHVLGQPFPQFPIWGFADLTICTAGFRNEQLNQVQKAIVQLGAKYSERLNSHCSLLVCPSLENVRKQKADFAMLSKIPMVDAAWLWQCIARGVLVPWDEYLCRELTQEVAVEREPLEKEKDQIARSKSEPVPKKELKPKLSAAGMRHGIDMTAFDDDAPKPKIVSQEQETDESNCETAPTRQKEAQNNELTSISAPLSEMTPNALNKSPSPQKTVPTPRKFKRVPTGSEVGDSESDGFDTPASPPENAVAVNQEEERKRQAERARAAKREEMSKRLTSLMSRDGAAQEGDGSNPQPTRMQQRRRREILGRAASNVSTASSASAESLTHPSSSKCNVKRAESLASRMDSVQATAGAFSLLDKMMMDHGGDSNQATEDGESPPRATQVEYDNPEARKHRAAVLGRMMSDSKQDDPSGSGQSQERGPSASVKHQSKIATESHSARGPSTRSTTRRR